MAIIPSFEKQAPGLSAETWSDVLKNQVGSSTRSMKEAARAGIGSDETSQGRFSGTGTRYAGWKESPYAPTSMTSVDPETSTIFGNRLGQYQSGGQDKFGYYGDVDIYNKAEAEPWLNKSGWNFAQGPEDKDYVNAGLDLLSYGFGNQPKQAIYKQGQYDFTQKSGVDAYLGTLGYTDQGPTLNIKHNLPELPGLNDTFMKLKQSVYGKKTPEQYLTDIGFDTKIGPDLGLTAANPNNLKDFNKSFLTLNDIVYGTDPTDQYLRNIGYKDIDDNYDLTYAQSGAMKPYEDTLARLNGNLWAQQTPLEYLNSAGYKNLGNKFDFGANDPNRYGDFLSGNVKLDGTYFNKQDPISYLTGLGLKDIGGQPDLMVSNPNLSNEFSKDLVTYNDKYFNDESATDFLSRLGYKDVTDSEYKNYTGLVDGLGSATTGGRQYWEGDVNQFGYGAYNDPNKLLSDQWNTLGNNQIADYVSGYQTVNGNKIADGWYVDQNGELHAPFGQGENPYPSSSPFGNGENPNVYGSVAGGFNYRGNMYGTKEEAESARQANLQQALSDPAIRSEVLAQALTTGSLNGVFAGDPTSWLDRDAAKSMDPLNLMFKISPWGGGPDYTNNRGRFGGDEIANELNADQLRQVLGGKDVQYSGNTLGSIFNNPSDPYHDAWSEYSQETKKNKMKTKKTTTTKWDYGDVGAGLSFNDPNWLSNNASRVGDNQMFISKDKLGSMPGAKAEDWYEREQGENKQSSMTGLGKVIGAGLSFIPVVGPMASMAWSGLHGVKQTPFGILSSVAGLVLGDITQGMGGLTGMGKLADSALIGAGTSGIGALVGGGNAGDVLKGAAIGGLSGAAGSYLGDLAKGGIGDLTKDFDPQLSKALTSGAGNFASALGKGAISGIGSGNFDVGNILQNAGLAGLGSTVGSGLSSGLKGIMGDNISNKTANTIGSTVAKLGTTTYQQKQQEEERKKYLANLEQQRQQALLKQQPRRV